MLSNIGLKFVVVYLAIVVIKCCDDKLYPWPLIAVIKLKLKYKCKVISKLGEVKFGNLFKIYKFCKFEVEIVSL